MFVTGYFSGTVDFGGGALVSAGGYDIFLTKYSPTGTHLWSQRFGSTGSDIGSSVATDPSGNVFVTGSFNGTVDFGGGALVSAGATDIILAKYSPTGTQLWSRRFGSTDTDYGYSVATDPSGNVFVTGSFNGTVDFGGGALVSAGGADIILARYSPTGVHLWSQRLGDTSGDVGLSVGTDASGNVLVAGYFNGTADFGGGPLVSAGSFDIFVAKYNSAGVHLWSQRFGDTGTDVMYSVVTDASGDIVVAGYFSGTVDFGGGALVSAGGYDIFIAKYSPTGAHLWSQRFGGAGNDRGLRVVTDVFRDMFLTGYFAETVDFGGGALVSAGGNDIFLAKFSPNGIHRWSYRFGSTGNDYGQSVATDPSGNVFVTGYFFGTVDFAGGALVSAGNYDIVVAKYSPEPSEPLIASIADIGNDQGRKVKIRFNRSGHDQLGSPTPIVQYEAYRRDAAAPALDATGRMLLDDGWTFVGSAPAHDQPSYALDIPTIGDSTEALGAYYSHFFVRAATAEPGTYFDSPADSGYSIDNLAPGVPGGILYNSGTLSWNESTAEDFDYFTVYGTSEVALNPALVEVIGYTVESTMDVTATPHTYFGVTATDFAGNESNTAWFNTLSGVGGTPTSYVLSVSNFPNPFNPSTTVSYTVPSRGNVSVTIYDARGARVATLVDNESRVAGAYRLEWNGRSESGAMLSSGIYFARVEQAGAVRTKKMVLLK